MKLITTGALGMMLFALGCTSKEPPRPPASDGGTQDSSDESSTTSKPSTKDSATPVTKTKPEPPKPKPRPKPPKAPEVAKLPDDPELRTWIVKRSNPDLKIRGEAADYLDGLDEQGQQLLLAAMQDADAEVRAGAAFHLSGSFNERNPLMVQSFLSALVDKDARVQNIALRTIGRLRPEVIAPATPYLIKLIGGVAEKSHDRAQAARVLGKVGLEAQDALPTLSTAVADDTDRGVRIAAINAVVRVAPVEKAVETLIDAVTDNSDEVVRRRAAVLLGQYGPSAATAAAALTKALSSDQDQRVRIAASDAISKLGEPAVGPLVKLVETSTGQARVLAIVSLGNIGPSARDADGLLRSLRDDSDPAVRTAAQAALQRIGGL